MDTNTSPVSKFIPRIDGIEGAWFPPPELSSINLPKDRFRAEIPNLYSHDWIEKKPVSKKGII